MRYVFVAVSAIVLFFPAFWLFSQVVGDDWGAGIAAIFMYIWYPFMALKFLGRNDRPLDDMSVALGKGELEVVEYEVDSVIEIEGDEEPFFLLSISADSTLCLTGQYLFEAIDGGTFPSSKIKVFWNRIHGHTYGVEGCGNKLIPERKLSPLSDKQLDSDAVPCDRDMISLSMAELVSRIESNA